MKLPEKTYMKLLGDMKLYLRSINITVPTQLCEVMRGLERDRPDACKRDK